MTVGSGRAVPDAGLVVAVDIGTTGVKAAAVDVAGVSHGDAEREYPTTSPHPGWAVQDPEAVTTAVVAVVREVMADVTAAGHPVAGIAFSSAMHSLIALGPDGSPLTPSVIWADERALPQARRLRESGDWLALHCRTGTPVHPMSPLVKLLWFREQEPEIWRRAAHWVGIKEYVLLRLAGVLAVDESIASATGLYGLATRDWDADALDLSGLRREQLPSLHATTDVVGRLGQEAATWGLPIGTPVVAGASDGVLANVGVGAVTPGVVACSIGTSGAIRGVVSEARVDARGSVFCYVLVPGRWVVGGATNNGGNVLRWLGRVIGADLADPDTGLTELAATAPPGAEGLLMLPYLAGERAPRWAGDPYGALGPGRPACSGSSLACSPAAPTTTGNPPHAAQQTRLPRPARHRTRLPQGADCSHAGEAALSPQLCRDAHDANGAETHHRQATMSRTPASSA